MRVFGVTGWKDMGKTTLVERLIALYAARGLVVSTIKHTHHGVDLDQPGRDSYRHRAAGASEVVLASARRVAILAELRDAPEWSLKQIIARMAPADLLLVEGYKAEPHPKLEVYRSAAAAGRPPLAQNNPTIQALIGDPGALAQGLPVFDDSAIDDIAAFILAGAVEAAA